MLTRRRIVSGKIETDEGTSAPPSIEDTGILAIDVKVTPDIAMLPRSVVMPTLSRLADLPGKQVGRIAFRVEIKGPGAAYSATVKPALGKYLRCCGLSETLVVTPGVETCSYKPATVDIPAMTLWCYDSTVIWKLRGARGSAKFTGGLGAPWYIDFDFYGVWDGVMDGFGDNANFEGTIPPVFLGATFTVGGYSAILGNINFDLSNQLTERLDVSNSAGVKSIALTDRDPRGSFDPEMVTVGTHDFFGRWKAGASGALVCGPVGATQYNRFTITAPKLVYTKIGDGNRGGMGVADTSFQLVMQSGDDEFVLAFH